VKSNCISIQPLETEFGRKRQIDQSSCNKDFSCIKGFCPSFVTVSGGKLKARPTAPIASNALPELPEPQRPAIHGTYNVLVSGIGGTGIVTIAQVLGMAAHLDGKACGLIDMAGLAQKGGAVFSHLRLAERPEDIHAIRIGARSADLVLAGDLVVAGNRKVLAAMRKGRSRAIVNTHQMLPGDFTRNADFSLPDERLKRALLSAAGPEATQFLDASAIAEALFGNSVGSNIFLVGVAFQMGSVPLSADAIERAIVLNGEAVEMNLAAFRWGRRAANDPSSVTGLAAPASTSGSQRLSETLDEMIARRVEFLADYQDAAYAARYRALVDKVRAAEAARVPGSTKLSEAVARYAFKLMAYKDEYEVARLYADGRFAAEVADRFEGKVRLSFHLAPTFLARRDKATGEPRKISFGPWLMTAFRLLARMKGLRGTPFDPFGWTAERRTERALVEDYFALMAEIVDHLSPDTHALAVGLAAIPEKIRGYGPVKARHLAAAKAEEAALLAQMRSAAPALRQAAE
jgi:indolepyruvate ferredoxin oxidoreductase